MSLRILLIAGTGRREVKADITPPVICGSSEVSGPTTPVRVPKRLDIAEARPLSSGAAGLVPVRAVIAESGRTDARGTASVPDSTGMVRVGSMFVSSDSPVGSPERPEKEGSVGTVGSPESPESSESPGTLDAGRVKDGTTPESTAPERGIADGSAGTVRGKLKEGNIPSGFPPETPAEGTDTVGCPVKSENIRLVTDGATLPRGTAVAVSEGT